MTVLDGDKDTKLQLTRMLGIRAAGKGEDVHCLCQKEQLATTAIQQSLAADAR